MNIFRVAVVVVVLAGVTSPGRAETLVALMSNKKLRHFDSTSPGAWTKTVDLVGLPAQESVQALDFRPDGTVIVVTREGTQLRCYDIHPETGVILRPGSSTTKTSANAVAFDAFAPQVHDINLVLVTESDAMSRFSYYPSNSGSLASLTLFYDNSAGDGDPVDSRVGVNPSIVGLAASNSFPAARSSVLYGVDSGQNTLVKITWGHGSMDTVAEIELPNGADLDFGLRVGFDISGVTGVAYLANGVGAGTNLYTVDLTSGDTEEFGRIGPPLQEIGTVVMDIAALPPAGLVNLSTRSRVGTGENVMIAGFLATGGASSRLVIRGLGPSLADAGVAGTLEDPVLRIYDINGMEIAVNDNWKTAQEEEIRATGVAPTKDREAAYVGTFAPGAYTAKVSGKGGGTGVGLVEIYRLSDN